MATPAPDQATRYAFLIPSATGPVHFPSCTTPITWALTPAGITNSGSTLRRETAMWRAIFAELEAQTPYRFSEAAADQPAAITIHYTDQPGVAAMPHASFSSGVAGLGGITDISWNGSHWITTGAVVILHPQALRDWRHERGLRQWLARHELGHALGLHHVDSPDQIMSPQYQPGVSPLRFGAGDIAGLQQLGTIGCARTD